MMGITEGCSFSRYGTLLLRLLERMPDVFPAPVKSRPHAGALRRLHAIRTRKGQQTSVRWRRMAHFRRTMKSAQPSSSCICLSPCSIQLRKPYKRANSASGACSTSRLVVRYHVVNSGSVRRCRWRNGVSSTAHHCQVRPFQNWRSIRCQACSGASRLVRACTKGRLSSY